MKYKCQDLPQPVYYSRDSSGDEIEYYSANQMAQHEQRAVAPLLAEIEKLENLLFEVTQYDDGGANVPE